MFKEVSYIYDDLIKEIDTCKQSLIDCIQKQHDAGRIRILKKSKPYRVGTQFYTNVRYVRNK